MKCKWCGKEYNITSRSKYCSEDCRYNYYLAKATLESRLKTVAKRNGFIMTDNRLKIEKAKLMLFRGGDYMRCPCKSFDESKYCGSEACLKEIQKNGVCCCGLFKKE